MRHQKTIDALKAAGINPGPEPDAATVRRRKAEHQAWQRKQNRGRIEHDPHRRGDLFARIMTDQILHDYKILAPHQVDRDCDLSCRTSTLQIARDCLSMHGLSTQGTKAEVVMRALQMDNMSGIQRSYSTDSFPGILDSIGSKAMSVGYDNAPETWPFIVRQTTTKNFLPFTRITAPELPSPAKVLEGGEIKRPALGSDSKETDSVDSYPFLVSLSRQAVISDDLNVLTVTAEAAGRAASRLTGDLVFAVLSDNAAMADSVALFHADHGNLVATGAGPSVSAFDAVRDLMSAQTAPSGEVANIRVALVIGPPSMESTLVTLKAALSSDSEDDPLTPGYRAGRIAVVTDARLTGNAWYAIADPRQHSGIEAVTLEGGERPLLERQTVFVSDSIEWKVLHDTTALPVDYRPLVKNPGA